MVGVFRRVGFILGGTAGITTYQPSVDGVAGTAITKTGVAIAGGLAPKTFYDVYLTSSSNETYQIHDFRLVSTALGGTIYGIVVYSENPSLSIDQFPGTTYNDKTESRTSVNTTLPLPSWGSSLGGVATIWKNPTSGYSMSTVAPDTITSVATGNSGNNQLTVTTGHGSSFAAGNGIISYFGSSPYIGVVQSVSTDTLTVFPQLPINVSGPIYRYFQAGQSLTIDPNKYILAYSFGATQFLQNAVLSGNTPGVFNLPYWDRNQNFAVWGRNIGWTGGFPQMLSLDRSGALGYLQVEGDFSAVDIEWVGNIFDGNSTRKLAATFAVNGLPCFSINGVTLGVGGGGLKTTVFTNAGPGWNNFSISPANGHSGAFINKINLYKNKWDASVTHGLLARFDTLQSFVPRDNNATCIAPGLYHRYFIDQLQVTGTNVRGTGTTLPGGVAAYMSNTNGRIGFRYYGTHFSVIGGSFGIGGSMIISLDGSANFGSTSLNTVIQSTLAFHSVSLAILGGTNIISGIDIFRPYGEMTSLQTLCALQGVTTQIPDILKMNQDMQLEAVCATDGLTLSSNYLYFDTILYDTFGKYDRTAYTAKYGGLYEMSCRVNVGTTASLHIEVSNGTDNGDFRIADCDSRGRGAGSGMVFLKPNDSMRLKADRDISASLGVGNYLYIKRIPGSFPAGNF